MKIGLLAMMAIRVAACIVVFVAVYAMIGRLMNANRGAGRRL